VKHNPLQAPTCGRRDWLKSLSLGGIAALLPAAAANSPSTPSAQANHPRGIIYTVSDGMSLGVLTLAQAFSHHTRQRGTHWWNLLNNQKSARGLMDNASANSMVTDSAAGKWGQGANLDKMPVKLFECPFELLTFPLN
jgi:alkaline phosphatase